MHAACRPLHRYNGQRLTNALSKGLGLDDFDCRVNVHDNTMIIMHALIGLILQTAL